MGPSTTVPMRFAAFKVQVIDNTHTHCFSASSIYNNPKMDYDPFQPWLKKGQKNWETDHENAHKRISPS